MRHTVGYLLCLCLSLGVASANEGFRTWTSAAGTKIEAKFVEMRDDMVVLERLDGNRVGVAVTAISGADQRYLASIPAGVTEYAQPEPAKAEEGESFRIWTSRGGSILDAKWISMRGDTVVVEQRDGTRKNLSVSLLSRNDMAYLQQLVTGDDGEVQLRINTDVISDIWAPDEWGGIGQTMPTAANAPRRLGQRVVVNYIGVHLSPWQETKQWPVYDLGTGPQDRKWQARGPKNLQETKTSWLILRRIQAGTFIMGSPEDEMGRPEKGDESVWPVSKGPSNRGSETQHEVRISRDFYMAIYQITQGQLAMILPPNERYNPADAARSVGLVKYTIARAGRWPGGGPDRHSICGILTQRTGLRFDLPTEAQWEYACRAGTTTALNNGKNLTTFTGRCPNLNDVAWYKGNHQDGSGYPYEVGRKRPNAWGLYDMHGLNHEWVRDIPGAYPKAGRQTDPPGTSRQPWTDTWATRVIRGGNSWTEPAGCRSASRAFVPEGESHGGFSIRVMAAAPARL